jgi:CBS domain containing-hemolysin-like protein
MTLELVGYAALALVGFTLSALFSGIETGVYTLNRVRLTVRVAQRDPAARRLKRELDNPNRALSTVLFGTNASNYAASYGLAALLHHFGLEDWTLIAVEAAVFTPLLFVFAETLPKDLFRTHTDSWTYRLSGPLVVARWGLVLCGFLPIVYGFGQLASRLFGASTERVVSARQHMSHLIKEGMGAGLLTESQTTLADRALATRARTVGNEAVAWSKVVTVPESADRALREAIMRRSPYSRFPVIDQAGRVQGILTLLDALLEPARTTTELLRDATTFGSSTPLRDALATLRARRQTMAIIVGPDGMSPIGLVTLKDLVEPITGELAAW